MLGLRRGFSQLSVAQYRCFSSVKFNNVSYGNYLKEANFQVEKGEKVALMGNKMSKAAILNIVGGNLEDVSGNVTAGNKVFVYQPRQSRSEQMQSVADFLKKNADSTLSDDAIKKLLETVKLGDVRAARSLSALSPSQQCRVQFASILLKNPDVILFDNPTDATHGLSHDDIEDLKAFIKGFGNTCIVDSADEDFLSAVSSAVLVVDTKLAGQSGAKLFHESYAAVKSQLSVKTRESHFDKTAKMQEASAQRSAMLHSDETDRALNELAFQNVASSVSQEEYIRVMLLIMALHPPALLGMYYMGLFDAII